MTTDEMRIAEAVRRYSPYTHLASVAGVTALAIEVADRIGALDLGSLAEIQTDAGIILAETAEIAEGRARLVPYGPVAGIRRGAKVRRLGAPRAVRPSPAWLGRVVDALGRPLDGNGPLPSGHREMPLRARAPDAVSRARLGPPVDFGIRALTAFAPACCGQRLGLFSASGVGKSSLLSMIARNTEADVIILAFIGERGREVREFIEDSLGAEGMARAVVVVATSDEPAMMRREAAFLAMALSEYFRDRGSHVLCLVDSLTRIAAAQREIGLAAGEPPTSKGYPPSVHALLPALLERAGPGPDNGVSGAITGVFSVLVEGDDHDEPIADAARAILDGHIVLERQIAERGRHPAVNVLRTVSRAEASALDAGQKALVLEARILAAAYDNMREMIRIGAYRAGANAEVDRAIQFSEQFERFLTQDCDDRCGRSATFERLSAVLAMTRGGAQA